MKRSKILFPILVISLTSCGESAYQIAVSNGFKGNESEWLSSLKGEDGSNGKDGEDGDTLYSNYLANLENGNISYSPKKGCFALGEDITFIVTADKGYSLEHLFLNGEAIDSSSIDFDIEKNQYSYSTKMIEGGYYVEASLFQKESRVFLIGGQSNATGISHIEYLANQYDETTSTYFEEGYPNIKINYYVDWGSNLSDGFTNVKIGQGKTKELFGVELGLAKALNSIYPEEEIYLIKCTYSGTALHNEWLDGSGNRGSLYQKFSSFCHEALHSLTNPKIYGMCWMQGEYDARYEYQNYYQENTKKLVSYLREDFKDDSITGGLYFSDAFIASNWPNYQEINQAKSNYASSDERAFTVDTISSGLSNQNEPYGAVDYSHYDATSEVKLGELFAKSLIEKKNI